MESQAHRNEQIIMELQDIIALKMEHVQDQLTHFEGELNKTES